MNLYEVRQQINTLLECPETPEQQAKLTELLMLRDKLQAAQEPPKPLSGQDWHEAMLDLQYR